MAYHQDTMAEQHVREVNNTLDCVAATCDFSVQTMAHGTTQCVAKPCYLLDLLLVGLSRKNVIRAHDFGIAYHNMSSRSGAFLIALAKQRLVLIYQKSPIGHGVWRDHRDDQRHALQVFVGTWSLQTSLVI